MRTSFTVSKLEEKLKLNSLFYDQCFENSNLGLILLDPQGRICKITQAAILILGGKEDEYIRHSIYEFMPDTPLKQEWIESSLHDGVTVQNKSVSWQNDTRQYELMVDSFPILNGQGQLEGVSVFMKDITHVRSLEKQLRRNDRLAMIGQMVAGTAHEIRNPLTCVKGFLQIMQNSLDGHDQLSKEVDYTHIMLEEIDRIDHLLGEFLLLSKSKKTHYCNISFDELMEHFLPIVHNEALLHDIDLEYPSFEDLPQVMGHHDLLKQVFLNICKNAIEAMGTKGRLQISYQVFEPNQMISIDFKDNGPGIPDEVLKHIFDPFFTTKESGTGLGLAVCQGIIHDMGGNILASTEKNGTLFRVQLPYITDGKQTD